MIEVEVMGWTVRLEPPRFQIADGEGNVRLTTDEWNPKAHDPKADGLFWAAAIADEGFGLTVDDEDDPDYAAMVNDVRANVPQGFADECSMLSQELDEGGDCPGHDADTDCEIDPQNPCEACNRAEDARLK